MIALAWVSSAFATQDCDRRPVTPAEVGAEGATALAVERTEGAVSLVPSTDGQVHLTGTVCSEARFKLVRRDGVIVATARVPNDAGLELTVAVPSSIATVTVHAATGPLRAEGVGARLAVVSSTGPVEVRGVGSLRVAYGAGSVSAEGVQADLVVDQRDGAVSAKGIGGNVVATDVSGGVTVDDVSGNLAVNGSGPVSQTNVRGLVTLP